MSNPSPFARRLAPLTAVPRGDVLGTYDTYAEAQQVVDRLSKADFPVRDIAIVGHDLTTVERITGRLTYGRAALTGAASGSWFGLFLGLLLFLFSPAPEFSFILAAAVIGAGFGMIFGIISYSINRRRRDFTSTHQVLAASYQIIIDPTRTARARIALAGGPAAAPAPETLAEKPAEPAEKPSTPADEPTDQPVETPAETPVDDEAEKPSATP